MLFPLYIAACIVNAIITIVTFFLYVKARLVPREQHPDYSDPEHAQKLVELDRRESRYQTIHFITLALFILFGVLILIHLSGKLNQGTITRGSNYSFKIDCTYRIAVPRICMT